MGVSGIEIYYHSGVVFGREEVVEVVSFYIFFECRGIVSDWNIIFVSVKVFFDRESMFSCKEKLSSEFFISSFFCFVF